MSITFSTPHINLTMNESKLHQVLTANTLEEATKINNLSDFIDKIIDWFKGGVKHQTIKNLFFSIQDIKNEDKINPESNRLEKFIELRSLVNPEHQSKFTLEIGEKDVNNDWGYKLKIDGLTLYECDKVFEKTHSYEEKVNLPIFCAKKIMMEVEGNYNKFKEKLENKESFITSKIKDMIVDEEAQRILKENLYDSAYSNENFIGFGKSNNKKQTFIARFNNGKEIEFSNIAPINSELRGLMLRRLLENSNYKNLNELILSNHLTEQDSLFKRTITDNIVYYQITQNNLYFDEKEKEVFHKELSHIKVGNTTLIKLWNIGERKSWLYDTWLPREKNKKSDFIDNKNSSEIDNHKISSVNKNNKELNPFRDESNNKLESSTNKYNEKLNPFSDEYNEELNPFSDEYSNKLKSSANKYDEKLNPFNDERV
ncbi:MAG TPA: hypothetical protein ACHBZ9_00320 [Arsenophonus nasoniae]|uniref:hypothetical protein n=1 Tax=Arsenophonus nasoniae TaxID=638 RepID=UPI003879605F